MNEGQLAIVIKSLFKSFRLPHEKHAGLKQAIVGMFGASGGYERQSVLKNISFEIKKGEFFGIVGRNGSGKSTLLKLLAGIYVPDKGLVQVNGSLTPFIELGVGFNPELTGRENVFLNGALLGFSRGEMDKMYDDIVAFAELDNFMDQKLKNYSSGMQVRLAFSIAIRAQSDVLLIDEVLAVGDALFQKKCFNMFKEIKKSGKTIVFISHDLGAVQSFCDRVAIISKGRLAGVGETSEMIARYKHLLIEYAEESKPNTTHTQKAVNVVIEKVKITNQKNGTNNLLPNEKIKITMTLNATTKVVNPVIGIGILTSDGVSVYGPNTGESSIETGEFFGRRTVSVTFPLLNLAAGKYSIRASVSNSETEEMYDFVEDLAHFCVIGPNRHGILYEEPNWEL